MLKIHKLLLANLAAFFTAMLWHAAYSQVLPLEHYTLENGLPLNWVTTLYQDSKGRLWIGGDGGFSVYDGISFKNYGVDDGLLVGHVWAIHESRKSPGTMYIGTHGGGLAKLENGKLSSILFDKDAAPPKLSHRNVVNAIFEDQLGVVWCGTNDGVVQVHGDTATLFFTAKGSGDIDYVEFLLPTRDGRIWFNLRNRLYIYSPKSRAVEQLQLGNGSDLLTRMVEDENGIVWIGTRNGAIFEVRDDRVVASRQTGAYEVEGILDDREGHLWIPATNGLWRIAKEHFATGELTFYSTKNGLPDNDLEFGLIDHERNLWLASRRGGLVRLSDRNITRFPFTDMNRTPDLLNHTAVADPQGHLFVPTERGLWEIWKSRDGSWQKFVHQLPDLARQAEKNSFIYLSSVALSADNVLWHTVHGGGLVAYKITRRPGQSSRLNLMKKLVAGRDLPDDNPLGVVIDQNNRLWYVPWRYGAVQIDPTTGQVQADYKLRKEISGGAPNAICSDLSGRVLLGSFAGGVHIFEPDGNHYRLRKRLQIEDGLASNHIRALLQRRNGEIWIGHRHDGISIYKKGECDTLKTKDGLLNNAVWALAEDDEGRVWIGTSVGLQYTAPDDSRKLFMHNQLVGRSIEGVAVIPGEKTIWAVSKEELTLYEYGRPSQAGPPPPVYILGLQVNGKNRTVTNDLSFFHNENICEMQFAGISFKSERSLRYKYRLLGLSEYWQAPTEQRAVTYGSLPPGEYKFEVTAINAEGVESVAPASLAFTILPPIWQRWWFIALGLLGLGALLYALHRLRLQRALAIEKIRSRIATDLHDDIGAGLTHIGLLSEVALRQARTDMASTETAKAQNSKKALEEMGQSMARVGEVARELSAAMSDVVWSINPKHDSVAALFRRLKAFANEICQAKGIKLSMEASDGILNLKLHPEVRRNLLLIAKEALHNTAKYSGSPSVEVRMEMNGHDLTVAIADYGRGFAVNGFTEGNGLNNMRGRAEKLGGHWEIVSEIGKGTRVTATVPHKT